LLADNVGHRSAFEPAECHRCQRDREIPTQCRLPMRYPPGRGGVDD
jgi:hypothetical protein